MDAARSLGFNLLGWKSSAVTGDQVDAADLIVVMDVANLESLVRMFPQAGPRTIILGVCDPSLPFAEVKDPYDLSPAATVLILTEILFAIDCLSRDLNLA